MSYPKARVQVTRISLQTRWVDVVSAQGERAERDFVEDGRGLLPAAKKLRRHFANVIVDERRFPFPLDGIVQMFAGSAAGLRKPGVNHRKPLTVEDARTG